MYDVTSYLNNCSKTIEIGYSGIKEITTNKNSEGRLITEETQLMANGTSAFQDLYWFENPKTNNKDLEPNEAGLVVLSLNINFNNIRINMYPDISKWKRKNKIFLNTKEMLTHATIYPADQFAILNLPDQARWTCTEQLLSPYSGQQWQDQLSTCAVIKASSDQDLPFCKLIIKDTWKENKPEYYFTFHHTQLKMFMEALKYCLTTGRLLNGMSKLK